MVSLSITTREVDGVSIVTLSGRIVFGEGSNEPDRRGKAENRLEHEQHRAYRQRRTGNVGGRSYQRESLWRGPVPLRAWR